LSEKVGVESWINLQNFAQVGLQLEIFLEYGR